MMESSLFCISNTFCTRHIVTYGFCADRLLCILCIGCFTASVITAKTRSFPSNYSQVLARVCVNGKHINRRKRVYLSFRCQWFVYKQSCRVLIRPWHIVAYTTPVCVYTVGMEPVSFFLLWRLFEGKTVQTETKLLENAEWTIRFIKNIGCNNIYFS